MNISESAYSAPLGLATYPIIAGTSINGAFSQITRSNFIPSFLSFRPIYGQNGVTLEVKNSVIGANHNDGGAAAASAGSAVSGLVNARIASGDEDISSGVDGSSFTFFAPPPPPPGRALLLNTINNRSSMPEKLMGWLNAKGPLSYDNSKIGIWVSGLYNQGHNKITAFSGASNDSFQGAALGLEIKNPKNHQLIGAVVGGGVSKSQQMLTPENKADGKTWSIGFYHSMGFFKSDYGYCRFDHSINFSKTQTKSQRLATTTDGSTFLAHKNTQTISPSISGEISHKFKFADHLSLRPFCGMAYSQSTRGAASEYDAGVYAISSPKLTIKSFKASWGGDFGKKFKTPSYEFFLHSRLGYAYDFLAKNNIDYIYTLGGDPGGYQVMIPTAGAATISTSIALSMKIKDSSIQISGSCGADFQKKRNSVNTLLKIEKYF